MTATLPTRIVRPVPHHVPQRASQRAPHDAPQLIIIESSGGTHMPPRTPSPTIGVRAAGLVATVLSALALLLLGIVGAVFTAVWVIVTLLVSVIRRGRSGPIVVRRTASATARPTSEAPRPTHAV